MFDNKQGQNTQYGRDRYDPLCHPIEYHQSAAMSDLTQEEHKQIVQCLLDIKHGRLNHLEYLEGGICALLRFRLADKGIFIFGKWKRIMFSTKWFDWPDRSHDPDFPIKPPANVDQFFYDPATYFFHPASRREYWDMNTDYGRARHNLLDHIIKRHIETFGVEIEGYTNKEMTNV